MKTRDIITQGYLYDPEAKNYESLAFNFES